jgi:hypothetical protein
VQFASHKNLIASQENCGFDLEKITMVDTLAFSIYWNPEAHIWWLP